MAQYSHTEKIAAPADKVWATIRNFGDGSYLGVEFESEGEGDGAVRRIPMGGDTIVERCERFDEAARVLGYTIIEGPLPMSDYHSVMEVTDDGDGSCLTWSATYEPVDDPEAAENVVKMIYANGSAAVKRHAEGTG